MSLLSLQACVVGYGGRRVAGPLDLEVRRGERVFVTGPNGSGKSTVLKTVLGSLPPLSGRATVEAGVRLGYVPQRGSLDPAWPATLEEVVRMGLPSSSGNVDALLAETGLLPLRGRLFRELSGGQKQRALLARALASGPDLLLLDEPGEGLDEQAGKALGAALGKRGPSMGILQVTHRAPPPGERVLALGEVL